MSDVPAQASLLRQLAGRWQGPLLAISLAALAAGVWRLRPVAKPPEFEPLYAQAAALHRAELYPEASAYVESLLAVPERTDEERRRLYGLMARIVYDHERGNIVHGPTNPTRILEYTDRALAEGQTHDGPTLLMRAKALEWLQKPEQAIAEYRAALERGVADPWAVRRRVIEIGRTTGELKGDALRAEYDAFLAEGGADHKLAWWAAEQIVELLLRQQHYEEAERLLAVHAERFRATVDKGAFEYLQSLIWYHMGRRMDAERLLRSLRDDLEPADPVYARSGWLLGRILVEDQAPEYALAFFDDVIEQTPPGPYWSASVLGRAEALASLERFDESLTAYEKAIEQATESPYESIIDLPSVRESLSLLSRTLTLSGRLPEARAYLRIAARLAPPSDAQMQAEYTERLAELAMSIGQAALARAEAGGAGAADAARESREHFIEAGEYFLRLSELVNLDEPASTAAAWHAADAFDAAGKRLRAAEALETFIRERPLSTQAPQALLRLGDTWHALGQYEKAIERYQENLIRFPRTPSAIASLVPLANCFIAIGQPKKAEATLLRVVEHSPGDPLGLITPAAAQFRDALFGLAALYDEAGEYEKAIARYEEAIERYADDPRTDGARFKLAEVYRRSAERIREDLAAGRHVARKTELQDARRQRLERARWLYGQVIEGYRKRPAESLDELDRLYLKLSYFYQADSMFELAHSSGVPDSQPFAEALEMYDRAAWAYQDDPVAMSAYVQMINCHIRLGWLDQARRTLQRARWALRNIPDEAFEEVPPEEGRAFWEEYFTWLEHTPTLAGARGKEG